MGKTHTKQELFQALTVLQEECEAHTTCATCPLSIEGACGVIDETPSNYKVHDPNKEKYRAFDN